METHVKVLGILHIALGSLGVLAALTIFAVFGGVAVCDWCHGRGG